MACGLNFLLESTLSSYARIFFSRNRVSGFVLLLATFISPAHGLAGLCGALSGNISALIFGMDREAIRSGSYGFNAVLLGLGLGAGYQIGWHLLGLMVFFGAALTGVTAALNYLCLVYLGLPALSIPFLVMMKIAPSITFLSTSLKPASARWSFWIPESIWTSPSLRGFLENLSAIFFQKSAAVGALAFVAVVLDSRVAASLLILGYTAAWAILVSFGFSLHPLLTSLLGFNSMLTALAIGGYFAVPSVAAFGFAAFAAGGSTLLILAVPSLAIPFNVAALAFGFLLRLRPLGSRYLKCSVSSEMKPERSFMLEFERSFSNPGTRSWISLPFYGSWKISQGIDGAFTHQGPWRFAYDFQAADDEGELFRGNGERVEEYYSFGSPVVAVAPGIVRALVDQIPDNPLGVPNLAQNWGNYVIIEHADSRFSCVAHLKKGSLTVALGEQVRRGQVVGLCGNSGRSLFPHLHFQMQAHPWIGAQTVEFEFENIVHRGVFHRRQPTLTEGQEVRNATLASHEGVESGGGALRVVDGMIHLGKDPGLDRLYEDIPFLDESVTMEWTSGPERGLLMANRRVDRALQVALGFLGVSIRRLRHYRLQRSTQTLGLRVRSEQFLELPWGVLRLRGGLQSHLILKSTPDAGTSSVVISN